MAFAAMQNTVPALGWLLFIANILWSVIYDTEYAMVDREDDLKAGARSTAILFGDADIPIIGVLMGTFLMAMVMIGTRAKLGWPYWLALVATVGLFGWQQWLIRHRERNACLAGVPTQQLAGTHVMGRHRAGACFALIRNTSATRHRRSRERPDINPLDAGTF